MWGGGFFWVGVFPWDPPFSRPFFPRRNRIIAGLSQGVVVIEAALRSGSLVTARLANEYGRTVFAVPGPVDSKEQEGCHALIAQGAVLLSSGKVIAEELPAFAACLKTACEDVAETLPELCKTLFRHFSQKPKWHIDELSEVLQMPSQVLFPHLFLLRETGRIAFSPGQWYERR